MKNPNAIVPRIEVLQEKKLIGVWLEMSLAENRTGELWRDFMSRYKDLAAGHDKFSLQLFDEDHFKRFDPSKRFVKWAAIEAKDLVATPEGMESMVLPGGEYAVFDYKGSSSDRSIFQYIYAEWLPNSDYQLEHRPHFELLGEKYKNNDPNSEEEIWIPVGAK